MFNFAYGPVGDLLGPNFTEQMQSLKRQLELKEKYQRPEGSSYNFSGDREQLAQDMADLGFVDNNPRTMEAITSKYTRFLNNLYGVSPISGQISPVDIPGGPGGETNPNTPPLDNYADKNFDPVANVLQPENAQGPQQPMIAPPGIGIRPPRFPSTSTPQAGVVPGIETLMPAEEEGYKKYIASDTNPFESMGISSLGQDALKQMIFERNNPQTNQSRGYKSYIG